MAINILDSSVYNRISAGEVVNNPASVVKELVENSIDAGADSIEITIKNGGIDYISVADNGSGINASDIEKIFLPHATSKIATVDDLENILTLGFRGEAMASIGCVSRVSLTTRHKDSSIGMKVNVIGGDIDKSVEFSRNFGTTVIVENLFYNVPVRAKFLKKSRSEESEISQLISRYILANPNINFQYIADSNTIYRHNGGDLQSAISCVYGADVTQNIVPVSYNADSINVRGYVSKIGFSKPNTTYQTSIVNGRYVIDETISKAVYGALQDYLMTRQFPLFILNIDLPVEFVDINIHPSKLNVKFSNSYSVYETVFYAIKNAIFDIEKKAEKIEISVTKELPTVTDGKSFSAFEELSNIGEINIDFNKDAKYDTKLKLQQSFIPEIKEQIRVEPKYDLVNYKIVGTIFNTYIIVEYDDDILLIDFHAGHERLNYDAYVELIKNKALSIQPLLVPFIYTANNIEFDFLMDIKDELFDIGFEIDEFGHNCIRILSVPVLLEQINLQTFMYDLLADVKLYKKRMPSEIKNYIMQRACKNAVRSGDVLEPSEIDMLLKMIDDKHPVLLCPHGRPITYSISRSMLDKWFKRIV